MGKKKPLKIIGTDINTDKLFYFDHNGPEEIYQFSDKEAEVPVFVSIREDVMLRAAKELDTHALRLWLTFLSYNHGIRLRPAFGYLLEELSENKVFATKENPSFDVNKKRLAESFGVSPTSVKRGLDELVDKGYLRITKKGRYKLQNPFTAESDDEADESVPFPFDL